MIYSCKTNKIKFDAQVRGVEAMPSGIMDQRHLSFFSEELRFPTEVSFLFSFFYFSFFTVHIVLFLKVCIYSTACSVIGC